MSRIFSTSHRAAWLTPHRRPVGMTALLVLCSILPATVPAAIAHEPPPVHGCTEPERPANDQDDVLWQRFLDHVDAFRACISDFVVANHGAADVHRDAANAATLDWNRFVRAELNVPEDYPWPPPARTDARP